VVPLTRGFKNIKNWKMVLLVLLIGYTGWMISACGPYNNHTSLMMDYPSPSPYPYAYYDNSYGYGPYDYPPACCGEPLFYGNYYGGYNGYYYNGGSGGGYYGTPSIPSHRLIR
jgi:hypothetical protein